MQDSKQSQIPTVKSRIDVFFEALSTLNTQSYLAQDAKDTVSVIRQVIGLSSPKSVVAAGLPAPARMLVETALKGLSHSYVEDLKTQDVIGTVSKADMGITWAQYGAARNGAIAEIVYDDALRLVSSLPRVHLALLSSKSVLPDLSSLVEKVGEVVRSSDRGKMPVVSLISGPSKTADIELRLIYGVHGPHSLHVLVLDWL